MRTEVIKADSIDVAVEGILNELNRSRQNVIYFDGWDGLGASAVLRAVAQRLALKEPTRPPGLEFDQIIHIDCSKWENTRAVQREIAEQLKLPTRVMDMFDKQDEEDDFDGITDQGSRTEIVDVAVEIQSSIQGRRFLLIFHNGSNEEVDLSRLGLPVYGYLTNKVVWTFQGRFRMDPKMRDEVVKKNTTDVLLSVPRSEQDPQHLWSYLVHKEAIQVACKHGVDPTIVAECFLYMLTLHCTGRRVVDIEYDLPTHACNYWICDVIIQKITDICEAWQVGEALQGEIRLDLDYHHKELPSHLLTYADNIPHWTSPAHGFVLVEAGVVPRGMFQHFDKLGVLKLSQCSFSFSSPPFQCCRGLRFLWLDHCQDLRSTDAEGGEQDENTSRSWACFQGLWVLDLRYTDCNWILSTRMLDLMTQLRELNVMGAKNWDGVSHLLRERLPNICKLRITKSPCFYNYYVFVEMESLELLDFSENKIARLYGKSTNSKLKTVIVSGCRHLEIISFRGCKELMNLVMNRSSLARLQEINLSGTSVKILDLSMLFSFDPISKRIILLGCEKLCTILWPQDLRADPGLDVLQIDTTSASVSASGREAEHAHPHGDQSLQQQKEEIFEGGWQISLADTRLLRSLYPVIPLIYFGHFHIDIFSASTVGHSNVQGTNNYKLVQVQPDTSPIVVSKYKDVLKGSLVATTMIWDCPKILLRFSTTKRCIIKVIMHGPGNKILEDAIGSNTSLLPDFICDMASSLHVYDNSYIASIPAPPQGSAWNRLRWCRVERCPKLHTVFNVSQGSNVRGFTSLETLWISQLLSARYILDRACSLLDLKFLHLDCCPMLLHALPADHFYRFCLETLEIVYCGDLREVFPLSLKLQEYDKVIELPVLRNIHLHELPSLQRICGRRISTPNLETIKIRGCWSLKRLPAVGPNTMPPKVDCEKEWWDNLEWDGLAENHHPSLYQLSHSLYHKSKLPRVSVLR